jgi:hypothetical protein
MDHENISIASRTPKVSMRVNDNISFSSQQKEWFLKTDFFYRLVEAVEKVWRI